MSRRLHCLCKREARHQSDSEGVLHRIARTFTSPLDCEPIVCAGGVETRVVGEQRRRSPDLGVCPATYAACPVATRRRARRCAGQPSALAPSMAARPQAQFNITVYGAPPPPPAEPQCLHDAQCALPRRHRGHVGSGGTAHRASRPVQPPSPSPIRRPSRVAARRGRSRRRLVTMPVRRPRAALLALGARPGRFSTDGGRSDRGCRRAVDNGLGSRLRLVCRAVQACEPHAGRAGGRRPPGDDVRDSCVAI